MMMTDRAPTQIIDLFPRGAAEAKHFLNCDYCIIEWPKNIKFGMIVIYYVYQ